MTRDISNVDGVKGWGCQRHTVRKRIVPGEGKPRAGLALRDYVLSEAGKVGKGLMFQGRSQRRLVELSQMIIEGNELNEVWVVEMLMAIKGGKNRIITWGWYVNLLWALRIHLVGLEGAEVIFNRKEVKRLKGVEDEYLMKVDLGLEYLAGLFEGRGGCGRRSKYELAVRDVKEGIEERMRLIEGGGRV